jgi:hypothetical protein
MAQGRRRKCKCCRKLFRPDPRNRHHQRYCSQPQCAAALAEDHERVRLATMRDRRTRVARVTVEPVTPVDIIGLYILIPDLS